MPFTDTLAPLGVERTSRLPIFPDAGGALVAGAALLALAALAGAAGGGVAAALPALGALDGRESAAAGAGSGDRSDPGSTGEPFAGVAMVCGNPVWSALGRAI